MGKQFDKSSFGMSLDNFLQVQIAEGDNCKEGDYCDYVEDGECENG